MSRKIDLIGDIRRRIADGEGTPDDYAWAAVRRQVLRDWPDELTFTQKQELEYLGEILDA